MKFNKKKLSKLSPNSMNQQTTDQGQSRAIQNRAIQTRDQVEDIAAQTVVSPATICENHFRARDSGTPWGYLAPTMDCRLPPLRERERRGGGGRVMRKREIGERKGDRRE